MDIMIFVFCMVFGIIAMAFLSILNSVHQSFHEIEWHDAQTEKPSLYVVEEVQAIRVLVHTQGGAIVDTWYFVNDDYYECEGKKNVMHFAYIDEVKLTLPPCPVCSGEILNSPYAYPGSL